MGAPRIRGVPKMRIVMFARVPGWYSFQHDRLAKRFKAEGHEIGGIVVEKTKTINSLREWMHKLGPRVMIRKIFKKIVGSKASQRSLENGMRPAENYPPCDAPVYHIASHNSDGCVEII